ncbi:hypothetical protein D0A34_27470 [Microcoleus vaginatus PCC 9802]|nr:hypothetical protein D0A34_27470 [Microcoleus vaginatus PCC 9802]
MAWRARPIERCTGITHNSVINCSKETGGRLSETEAVETIPEVSEIDEIQIFVDLTKKQAPFMDSSKSLC